MMNGGLQMKVGNLYMVLYYDSNNDKYIEMSITKNKNLAYECYNILVKKYPDELYVITKVLEV